MKQMGKAVPAAVAVTTSLAIAGLATVGLFVGIGLGSDAAGAAEATRQIIAQAAPAAADRPTRHGAQRRPPTHIRVHPRYRNDDVYPRYDPGPNAVRDCTATYVQEFRPSGTVIVPRMRCFWRQG